MEWSDGIACLALLLSGGALWYSKKADKRASAAEARELEEHQRNEVFFVAEFDREILGDYDFRLINTGTKTALWPKVDPSSVERVAVTEGLWPSAKPNIPLRFRYEKTRHGQLESIVIRWDGPGVGEQTVPIPSHRRSGD